jgi:hypothetical protein
MKMGDRSLRAELAAAVVEYDEHNKKAQEVWQTQGRLSGTLELLRMSIVEDEELFHGTKWKASGVEKGRPSLRSHWKEKCFEGLMEILGPDYHSHFQFDDFQLSFSDGDMYITQLKVPLAELIEKYRLRVDWSSYEKIDDLVADLEERIACLRAAKEMVEGMLSE